MIQEEKDILCNKCGQSLFNSMNFNGLVEVGCDGAMDSTYLTDLMGYSFSICEKCLVEYMGTFKIPARIEEYDNFKNYGIEREKHKKLILEIKNVKKALHRTECEMRDLEMLESNYDANEDFGGKGYEYDYDYQRLVDKANKQRWWLSVLLKRQGLDKEAKKVLLYCTQMPQEYQKKKRN